MTTEQQALRCVTHHYACDCREYRHEQEVARLKRLLQRATDTAYWRSSPEACGCMRQSGQPWSDPMTNWTDERRVTHESTREPRRLE